MKNETKEFIKSLLERERDRTKEVLMYDIELGRAYQTSVSKYQEAFNALDDYIDFLEDEE